MKKNVIFIIIASIVVLSNGEMMYELSISNIPKISSENSVKSGDFNYRNLVLWGIGAYISVNKKVPLFLGIHGEYGQKLLENIEILEAYVNLKENIYFYIGELKALYKVKLPFDINFYPCVGIGYAYCLNSTKMNIYNGVIQNGQIVRQLAANPDIRYSNGFLWFAPELKLSRLVFKNIGAALNIKYIKIEKDLGNLEIKYTTPSSGIVDNPRKSMKIGINNFDFGLDIYYEL